MSTRKATFSATPDRVEEVLLDARAYPRWVIGTDGCDEVHDPWPLPGGSFTYRVKIGPFRFRDRTTLLEHVAGRHVKLHIAIRPFGEAHVVLRFEQAGSGTRVVMEEHPVRGMARWMWNRLADRMADRRNEASLERLRGIVEDHATAA